MSGVVLGGGLVMKKIVGAVFIILLLIIMMPILAQETATMEQIRSFAVNNIHWAGNGSIKLSGSKSVYIDPAPIVRSDHADIVLITHDHDDHFNEQTVKRLMGSNTILIAPDKYLESAMVLKLGEKTVAHGIAIEAVPAYNINKLFHPKSKGWVGYIVTLDGIRIYVSGDTDHIPEMKGIKADVAILNVGGNYMMDDEEAALAALDIKPKIAIPYHYMGVAHLPQAGRWFKENLDGKIEVIVKSPTVY